MSILKKFFMLLLAKFAFLALYALYTYNWTNNDTDSTNDGSSNGGLNYADLRITPGSLVTKDPRSEPYKNFDILNNGGKIGDWDNSYLVRISYSSQVIVKIQDQDDVTLEGNGDNTYSNLAKLKYGLNTITIDETSVNITIPNINSANQTEGNRGCLHFGDPSGYDMGDGCAGWGSPGMFERYKYAWNNYGSDADCVTFGGDNFYDPQFNCAKRFYINMHNNSLNVSMTPPFSTVLMLSVAGNHDYIVSGEPGDCENIPAPTLHKYLSFVAQDTFNSGTPWPDGPTRCPIKYTDFAYTYGVYVIGQMGFITWNDGVNPPDNTNITDLAINATIALNAFPKLKQIYYISHWSSNDHGALADGPANFNNIFKNSGFKTPIQCIVNHEHINCIAGGDYSCAGYPCSKLGGGGLDGGKGNVGCADHNKCSVSLIHSDKLIPSGANRGMSIEIDSITCRKHQKFINSKKINPFTSPLMEPRGKLDAFRRGPERGEPIYSPLTKSDWLTVMRINDNKFEWKSLVLRFGLKKSVNDKTKYWASCKNLIKLGIICDTSNENLTDSHGISKRLNKGLKTEKVGCIEQLLPDFSFRW